MNSWNKTMKILDPFNNKIIIKNKNIKINYFKEIMFWS
jgi:hypothetical protein